MSDVADRGYRRRRGLDNVDAGGGSRRRNAHANKKSGTDHSEGHAQRAINQLRRETDEDEGQKRGRISQ